jgi:hypothetical protein
VVNETVAEVLAAQATALAVALTSKIPSPVVKTETPTTKIEDQHVALAIHLLVETVGNSGNGRVV